MDAIELWEASPELQREVRDLLREWGQWSRSDPHNLRYPAKTPGLQMVSNTRSAPINVDRAECTEWFISSWNRSTPTGKRAAFLLKLVFVERKLPAQVQHHYNRKFKTRCSFDEVLQLINAAERGFFLLTR